MAVWELQSSGTISHDSTVLKTLPTTANEYGPEYVYDISAPEETITLNATPGFTLDELTRCKTAARTRNAVVTCTDSTGTTHTGRITALSWEVIAGTAYYTVSMTLRSVALEATSTPKTTISLTF